MKKEIGSIQRLNVRQVNDTLSVRKTKSEINEKMRRMLNRVIKKDICIYICKKLPIIVYSLVGSYCYRKIT